MGLGPRVTGIAVASSLFALVAAQPTLAATVTVKDIAIGGAYAVTVPSVEAVDTNLTEAQIRAVFSGGFLGEAGALAQLDATRITIPELRLNYDLPGADGAPQKATVIYRDIELAGVTDGVATSASIGSGVVEGGAGVSMTFGKMSAGTFDIGGLLSFYGVGDKSADPETFKTLYADFNFEGATFAGPGFSCDVGGATLADFSARPLKSNFTEITQMLGTVEKASPAEQPAMISKIIDFYVDILTAFKSTPMQMSGFTCAGTGPEGEKLAVTAGAAEVGGFAPGVYPYVSVSDLGFDLTDVGSASLGNFTVKQTDFNNAIAAIMAHKAELSEAWFEKNWRLIIPAFDGLSFSKLAVDLPNPEGAGCITGSVGDFDVSLADWFSGVPTNVKLSAHNVVFTPPDMMVRQALATIGIETVDAGYDIAARWDVAKRELLIDNLSLTGAQMGTVSISAVLGGAGEDLLSDNQETAMGAAMNLTIKDLTLNIDDAGISYLLLGIMAEEQKQDPMVMRAGLSAMASGLTMGILGNTPAALKAATQIAAFLNGTPKLTVHLTANDPAGISMLEIMAAENDPRALAGRFTVEAAASGEPIAAPIPLVIDTTAAPQEPDETMDAPADSDAMEEPTFIEPPDAPPAADLSPAQADKLGKKN